MVKVDWMEGKAKRNLGGGWVWQQDRPVEGG